MTVSRDHEDKVFANALWQFNEAVSLLREARQYVPEATGIQEEIDESLPKIQDALQRLADVMSSHDE